MQIRAPFTGSPGVAYHIIRFCDCSPNKDVDFNLRKACYSESRGSGIDSGFINCSLYLCISVNGVIRSIKDGKCKPRFEEESPCPVRRPGSFGNVVNNQITSLHEEFTELRRRHENERMRGFGRYLTPNSSVVNSHVCFIARNVTDTDVSLCYILFVHSFEIQLAQNEV